MFFYDPLFVLVILIFILSLIVQSRLNKTFKKWSQVPAQINKTAAEVAHDILTRAGLSSMPIKSVAGNLTDHYNPINRTLNLSEDVYNSTSVAAIGIAAHEAGHAIQHKTSFLPLVLRNGIYPLANISSTLAYPIFIIGFFLGFNPFLMQLAIYLFLFATAFTIITLPVEFDASNRAKRILYHQGYLTKREMVGVNSVLNTAAMTYVMAALSALLNLIRMILISNSRD